MGSRERLRDQIDAARDAVVANDLLGRPDLADRWRARTRALEVVAALVDARAARRIASGRCDSSGICSFRFIFDAASHRVRHDDRLAPSQL